MLGLPYVQTVSERQVPGTLGKGLAESGGSQAAEQVLLQGDILCRAADAVPVNQGAAWLAVPISGMHLVKASAMEVEDRIALVANQGRWLVSCNGATAAAAWHQLQELLMRAQGWPQRCGLMHKWQPIKAGVSIICLQCRQELLAW